MRSPGRQTADRLVVDAGRGRESGGPQTWASETGNAGVPRIGLLVDEVVSDWSSDKFEMWKQLRYDILFKADDWKGTRRGPGWRGYLVKSVRVCTISRTPPPPRVRICAGCWRG
jgi:hypothetical protein